MKFLKKLLVFLIFVGAVGAFYHFQFGGKNIKPQRISYRDDFKNLDRDFWYVGEWETMFKAYDKVKLQNGILTATFKETDRGPFLLSKPIPIKEGDVVTVKRRVKIHYANDKFMGGFALIQTNDTALKPIVHNNDWGKSLGQAIALVEYVHFYSQDTERPGRDIFRVMGPNWKEEDAYVVLEPTFDDWFEESLIFDTRNDEIRYNLGEKTYRVSGQKMDKSSIRVFMHAFGWNTGHSMKLDWVDIQIESTKVK